jgi:hypothetical protein
MWKHEIRFIYTMIIACVIGSVLIYIAVWDINNRSTRTKLDKVESDWKMLVSAMDAQAMDWCGIWFPADTLDRRKTDPNFPLTFECSYVYTTTRQAEEQKQGINGLWRYGWNPLTTPVAYCKAIPEDPFNPGNYYGYTTWIKQSCIDNTGHLCPYAILYSRGPDQITNIPLIKLRTIIDDHFKLFGYPNQLAAKDFRFLSKTITPILYDPTNGTYSSGDLIWFIEIDNPYGWRRDKDLKWHITAFSPDTEALLRYSYDTAVKLNPEKDDISIPISFYNLVKSIGIFSNDHPLVLIDGSLDGVRNHLGRNYASFFVHPRQLTEQEKAELDTWKISAPEWWNAMDKFTPINTNNSGSLHSQIIYPLMPLFGKSQLLLAADEWGQNKKDQALQRVRDLQYLVNHMYFPTSEERIQKELNRLAIELEYKILGIDQP